MPTMVSGSSVAYARVTERRPSGSFHGSAGAPVARTLSLLRRDSSRRGADIDMSVDAARKSACATEQRSRNQGRADEGVGPTNLRRLRKFSCLVVHGVFNGVGAPSGYDL
jgi:hypothetical protein